MLIINLLNYGEENKILCKAIVRNPMKLRSNLLSLPHFRDNKLVYKSGDGYYLFVQGEKQSVITSYCSAINFSSSVMVGAPEW